MMQPEKVEARTAPTVSSLNGDCNDQAKLSTPIEPRKQEGPGLKPVPYVEFSDSSRPFDWLDDADSIIVEHSPGIAIYVNGNGHIVVRQHDYPEDGVVVIAAKDARRVAKAITGLAR